ncbi:MAG: PLP-dependent transferase [Azoarcus sp.]|nr:PLP-dependent transferase [Azoarcus sp.]
MTLASGQTARRLSIATLMGAGGHIVASRSLHGGSHDLCALPARSIGTGAANSRRSPRLAKAFTTWCSPKNPPSSPRRIRGMSGLC